MGDPVSEHLQRHTALYRNLRGDTRVGTTFRNTYAVSVGSGVQPELSQRTTYGTAERVRDADILKQRLMQTQERNVQERTERLFLERQLRETEEGSRHQQQRIHQLEDDLRAALHRCETLARYETAGEQLLEVQDRVNSLEADLSRCQQELRESQTVALAAQKASDDRLQREQEVSDELRRLVDQQRQRIAELEALDYPGISSRAMYLEAELQAERQRAGNQAEQLRSMRALLTGTIGAFTEELNHLNSWLIGRLRSSSLLGPTSQEGDGSTSSETLPLTFSRLCFDAREADQSTADALREACLKLHKASEGARSLGQMLTQAQTTTGEREDELATLNAQLVAAKRNFDSKCQEVVEQQALARAHLAECQKRGERLAAQEARIGALTQSADDYEAAKDAALRLVDTLTELTLHKSHGRSPQRLSDSPNDSRLRYATQRGLDVCAILADAQRALRTIDEQRAEATAENMALLERLEKATTDMEVFEADAKKREQSANEALREVQSQADRRIDELEGELARQNDFHTEQAAQYSEELQQMQTKVAAFSFVVYALLRVMEADRFAIRNLHLEKRILEKLHSGSEAFAAEVLRINEGLEASLYPAVTEDGNPTEYAHLLARRRSMRARRRLQAVVHASVFVHRLSCAREQIIRADSGLILRQHVDTFISQTGQRETYFEKLDALLATTSAAGGIPSAFYGAVNGVDHLLSNTDLGIKNHLSILEQMRLPDGSGREASEVYCIAESSAIAKLMSLVSRLFIGVVDARLLQPTYARILYQLNFTSMHQYYMTTGLDAGNALVVNLSSPQMLLQNLRVCAETQAVTLQEARSACTDLYTRAITAQHTITSLEGTRTAQELQISELKGQIQYLSGEIERLPTLDQMQQLRDELQDLTMKLRESTSLLAAERSHHETLAREYERSSGLAQEQLARVSEEKARLEIEVQELRVKLLRSRSGSEVGSGSIRALSKSAAKDLLTRAGHSRRGSADVSGESATPTDASMAKSLLLTDIEDGMAPVRPSESLPLGLPRPGAQRSTSVPLEEAIERLDERREERREQLEADRLARLTDQYVHGRVAANDPETLSATGLAHAIEQLTLGANGGLLESNAVARAELNTRLDDLEIVH
ncbi:hypothetical protein GMRT_12094 [Giardia muris]|uniref:Uncharacterized protein n=1 Tax=Giardia muris TaxID=5742 RepID=A0A4Z1T213_GIAMU|nr:hypothetical protein GMRT_12094 [Giardia muris]|eukprot:TNJ27047.1 hypothetical protein GMRT_12094 [Giardia muris]